MRIVIVDDNEYSADSLRELISEVFPDASIQSYETLHQAISVPADVLIIDISAVYPIVMSYSAYHHICTYLNCHPGTTVIINSAVSSNTALAIRDDVIEQTPDADVRICHFGDSCVDLLGVVKKEQCL